MSRRLPPLTWLRAFEAAGRLQSFRAAADELAVTPSTVSHQIADLEQRFGRPLFERRRNGVHLTREGAAYLEHVTRGFTALADAGRVFEPMETPRRLTLGAFPFLVSEVLMPALGELRARLPGVALRIVSDTRLAALTAADPAERLDAIVRYGDGRFPGCRARELTHVGLVPVAHPALAGEGGGSPADALERLPRITVAGPFDGWAVWCRARGVELPADGEILEFDSYLSAMHAVEQRLGVGIGIVPFIDTWVRARRVVALEPQAVPVTEASYLVTARHRPAAPALDVLGRWLEERLARPR